MVLKKELVQVQTLMDQMTLESEKKGQEVELERQNLQQLLSEANRRAEVVQREFEQFKVHALVSSIPFFCTSRETTYWSESYLDSLRTILVHAQMDQTGSRPVQTDLFFFEKNRLKTKS